MTAIKRALGMMSGTSVDGSVSAAIIDTDGADIVTRIATTEFRYESDHGVRPIHHLTKAAELAYRKAKGNHSSAHQTFPSALREYIETTFSLKPSEIDDKLSELTLSFGISGREMHLSDVIQRSTEVHIQAARHALQEFRASARDIAYIGYHGQTLYHDPFFNKVTVQVGDPQTLADELQIPVVFDFRSNDVAHGGQGAPLAPVYHRALVRCAGIDSAAILNLGGTANVTVVSSKTDELLGFDTGPANGLIDRFVKEKAGIALDKDSHLAEQGTVSETAVRALVEKAIILKDGRNFLEIRPPKSLDIRDYTFDLPEFRGLSVEDGCATLNAFTAECVALGTEWIRKAGFEVPLRWVLCGGGAYSPHLRSQLTTRLTARLNANVTLLSADDVGWSAQGMEAELFAYIAIRSVRGLPLTYPGTTGVKSPTVGGRIFLPKG
jgi:anhydro-N-acetylmuramic acid kinase